MPERPKLVALPMIRMAVEAVHGVVDHGGERFGFILMVGDGELQLWRVSGRMGSPIPSCVRDWVAGKGAELCGMVQ